MCWIIAMAFTTAVSKEEKKSVDHSSYEQEVDGCF